MQREFSGTQVFVFEVKSLSNPIVSYFFEKRFHNFRPRKEGVSVTYFVVRILFNLECEFVLREYGFLIKSKISLMDSGDKPDFSHKFLQIVAMNSYPL